MEERLTRSGSDGDNRLPVYNRLTFKFLASIAVFILLIEAILFLGSMYGMETRILQVRQRVAETVNQQFPRPMEQLDPEQMFPAEAVDRMLFHYGRNIVVMVVVIMAVVLTGVYFILRQWVLTPLRTILDYNVETTSASIEYIPQSEIPADEFGRIMSSRNEMLKTLKDVFSEEAIETLVSAVDAKDRYTRGHSTRVGTLSRELGKELECSRETLEKLTYSGILHDVGKISIPDEILTKPDALTDEEFSQIEEHPARGEDMIRFSQFDQEILDGIRHHHEQYDGRGYPDGLAGDEIPLFGRIIAVADAVDAMLSTRHYRDALTITETKDQLRQYKGQQFDPDVAEAGLSLLRTENRDRLPAQTAEKVK